MKELAQNKKHKKKLGGNSYLNKKCWLVKNLNYSPYKRCQYCELRFQNCLFLHYQIVSLILMVLVFSLFFIFEHRLSILAIIVVFVIVIVYGFFFNKTTERIIQANFLQKQAKDELKKLTDELEVRVDEQTHDIQKKAEHLKKLLKLRSEFLDIASHQLRTPTSVIKGIISMMMDGDLGRMPKDKQKNFIKSAFEKSLKLEQIIHDLLTASEFDSKKYQVSSKTPKINLTSVIDSVVANSQFTASRRGIKLSWLKPTGFSMSVIGEERYLEEAFSNLIDNAIKYTPSKKTANLDNSNTENFGIVKITAENDNKNIIIKIQDNGIGIPKNEITKLFQKFKRAENATEMYADGSGLGLFIVKEIIEGHNGHVTVTSKINQGSIFSVSLPIAK